jgi:O-acetyl-ADP-ribose deacetylase (regulator of RNase III)
LHACRKALETAREMSLKSLSIPPLASGKHGYPKPRAARLIVQGIDDRLDGSLDEVRIVCRAAETLRIFRDRLYEHGWAGD